MNRKGRVETVIVWIALAIIIFVILAFVFKNTVFGAQTSIDQMLSCKAKQGKCDSKECKETQMLVPAKCLDSNDPENVCCVEKSILFGEEKEKDEEQ